jgi:hypothetical protein
VLSAAFEDIYLYRQPEHVVPEFFFFGDIDENSARVAQAIIEEWKSDLLGDVQPSARRANALMRLAEINENSISRFIANELKNFHKTPASFDWLGVVVAASELVQFADDWDRRVMRSRLRAIARMFIGSGDPKWERVVWSAIRTYASMIEAKRIGSLAEFLVITGDIDTRQVTLQMIRQFAGDSFTGSTVSSIKDRIHDLVRDCLSKCSSGDTANASLFTSAFAAMVAIEDIRLAGIVPEMCISLPQWLIESCLNQLREIMDEWPASVAHSRTLELSVELLIRKLS